MWRLFALTFALVPAAHAETYKWLDERGVVNYSNTPPPAAVAKVATSVADRVSTYQTDPALRRVSAYTTPSPYEQMLQQEWLQRQRLMAESQNLDKVIDTAPVEPLYYRSAYYTPYGTGYYRGARPIRPVHHRGDRRR